MAIEGEKPTPPWRENPSRLLSLWEMLPFAAYSFVQAMMQLRVSFGRLKELKEHTLPMTTTQVVILLNEELRGHLETLGFQVSIHAAERISRLIELTPEPDPKLLGQLIEELVGRVEDELKSALFFSVSPDKYRFYEPKHPLFGEQVREHFPSAAYDIDEAGKCFALARYTACVFHLMRALEVCLKLLAQELSVSCDGGGNWNKVLNEFDKALQDTLRANTQTKPPEWKEQEEFYSEASALLRNVKNAWRNSVMHAKHIYDEDRARAIFDAVGGIMRHLATRLKEGAARASEEDS